MSRIDGALITLLSTLGVLGCAPSVEPCLGATGCPRGTECLGARCVAEGTTPVEGSSDRLLLSPVAVAIASRSPSTGVASSVTLGNAARSPAALYARFQSSPSLSSVSSAFLLLEPTAGALTGPDVELEVASVDQPWEATNLAWSNRPRASGRRARGLARSTPPLPVRIDITELVKLAWQNPDRDYGYVIEATGDIGVGITVDTGIGGGEPPRLDVYGK